MKKVLCGIAMTGGLMLTPVTAEARSSAVPWSCAVGNICLYYDGGGVGYVVPLNGRPQCANIGLWGHGDRISSVRNMTGSGGTLLNWTGSGWQTLGYIHTRMPGGWTANLPASSNDKTDAVSVAGGVC